MEEGVAMIFLGSRRAWIHFSFLPSMIGGVTRKQPSLNDQGCAERFKVICSLIQIQSAKTWAFHIPTILPLCAISPDPYPLLFYYFFLWAALCNGLRSAKRPRSPLIHINSAKAVNHTQAFLCPARTQRGGGEVPKTMYAHIMLLVCSAAYLHAMSY